MTQRSSWRGLFARLFPGEVRLRTTLLFGYALLMGALGGLAEAGYLTIRHLVRRELAIAYFPEVLWMAPIAGALAFIIVAIPMAVAARIGRTRVDVTTATLVFSGLAVFGVVQSRGFPFHVAAKAVLCLGIAMAIARGVDRRPAAAARTVARLWPVAAAALVVLGVAGATTLPGFTERRRLGRLPETRVDAPNVLLIILDTVRAANLSLYGYPRTTSPRLDEWADSGVTFDRAASTAPWTLPSHASLFTGEYNFTVGTAFQRPLDDRHAVLAEALRDRGYATAAFVANLSFATRASGLGRGFARYDDLPFTPGMFAHSYWILRGVSRRIAALSNGEYWATSKSAEEVTDAFLGWLRQRPDRPFFVFLNYFDAHDPYEPPAPFRTMYGPAPDHELSDDEQYTTEQLGPWINAYDGAITYIDGQLARIFEALDASDLTDNTLVIVTSDHGEMFGEHGQIQHTSGVYIPVLHVPLVISLPGVVPAGARVAAAVSLRDIPATVLDLTNQEAGSPFRGRSLAAHWSEGEAATSPVLSEMDFHHREIMSDGHLSSLIDGPFQYVRMQGGSEELYDVIADPRGELNVADRPGSASVLTRMRATLDSLLTRP